MNSQFQSQVFNKYILHTWILLWCPDGFGQQLGEFGFTAGAVAADTIEFAAKMHIQMHKNKDMKIFKKGIL